MARLHNDVSEKCIWTKHLHDPPNYVKTVTCTIVQSRDYIIMLHLPLLQKGMSLRDC